MLMVVMKEMGSKIHKASYNGNREQNRLQPPMAGKQVTVSAPPKQRGMVVDGVLQPFQ